jgi:hypothetical protein
MKINVNIKKKIDEFPEDIQDVALMLINELEKGKMTKKQISGMIKNEVRELVAEEDI